MRTSDSVVPPRRAGVDRRNPAPWARNKPEGLPVSLSDAAMRVPGDTLLHRIRGQGRRWYGDVATWRFVLFRYLPTLALLNLIWEVAQLPLYTLWFEAPPAFIAFAVLHCTAGDVLIGGGALFATLIATRSGPVREWRWRPVGALTLLFGLLYTAFSEWMNTAVSANWTYTEAMPVLPLLPIGLAPLLQWLIVPAATLALTRPRTVACS